MSRPWCWLQLTFPHSVIAWSIGIFHSTILWIFLHSETFRSTKNQTVNSKSPTVASNFVNISRMFRFFQHFGQSQCQRSLLLPWRFCSTLAGPYSGHLGLARDLALWKTGTKGAETVWLCIEKPCFFSFLKWGQVKNGDDSSHPFVGVTYQTYQLS